MQPVHHHMQYALRVYLILKILVEGGDAKERSYAQKILPGTLLLLHNVNYLQRPRYVILHGYMICQYTKYLRSLSNVMICMRSA